MLQIRKQTMKTGGSNMKSMARNKVALGLTEAEDGGGPVTGAGALVWSSAELASASRVTPASLAMICVT